jgi:hypothetical protein
MAISTYLGNKIIDAIVNATTLTGIATPYISLHTGDPGLTGANEVTGGSYARQAASFAAGGSKASETDTLEEFTGMPACTVTHIGIWDAASGGNFLWGGTNSGTQGVAAGNTFRIASGALDISVT